LERSQKRRQLKAVIHALQRGGKDCHSWGGEGGGEEATSLDEPSVDLSEEPLGESSSFAEALLRRELEQFELDELEDRVKGQTEADAAWARAYSEEVATAAAAARSDADADALGAAARQGAPTRVSSWPSRLVPEPAAAAAGWADPRSGKGPSLVVDHPTLVHRRYLPVMADLKCVLNVEGVARAFAGFGAGAAGSSGGGADGSFSADGTSSADGSFSADGSSHLARRVRQRRGGRDCLGAWLETLMLVQGCDRQTRKVSGDHVE
jgi:hypothetical protein